MSAEQSAKSGVERAAILLMTLGEQDAAAILKQMSAKEVQRVGSAMAQLSGLTRDDVSGVLERFMTDLESQTAVGVESDQYLRNVLLEALGAEKANPIVDRILGGRRSRGLEALKWMDGKAIAEMLRQEHPQIVAIVLSYLDADHAASVLNALPAALRPDIVMRVATLGDVHPSAMNELDQVLEKQFVGGSAAKSTGLGGAKVAANILNLIGGGNEGFIIDEIGKADATLSEQLRDLMFVFEDLMAIDDRGIQALLREVSGDKLVIAMKAADEEMKTRFLKNMSQSAAETLRDDLETKGPVKLSEVEAAQKEIVLAARRLADEGKLQLGGKGGEQYV